MSQHHYSQKFAGSEFLEEGERLIVSTEYIRSTTRSPANIGRVGLCPIIEKKKKEPSKEVDIHIGFIIGDLGIGKTTFSSGITTWIRFLSEGVDISQADKLVVILDLPAPIHLRDKDLDEIINKPLNSVLNLVKENKRTPKIKSKKHFFIATGPETMSSTSLLDPGEAAERIRDVFYLRPLKDLMRQAISDGGEFHIIVLKCDLLTTFSPIHYTIEAEYTIKEFFDVPLGTTIEVGWFNQFSESSVLELWEEARAHSSSKSAEMLGVLHTAAKKLVSSISGEVIEATLDVSLKNPKWD
ncbi:MAG: hypothetical protein ACFFBD_15445 [Candidatus Hodarchaeota archaeon]